MDNYILVTSAKNEEALLPQLINSVVNQNKLPTIWVIVNDGSHDKTENIIIEASQKHLWIRLLSRNDGPHHGLRYSEALREGFDLAIQICQQENKTYSYLALIDADMSVQPDHFEKMVAYLKENPALGLASCGIYYYNQQGHLMLEPCRLDWPRGPQRLWRRECYEQSGGQPIAKSADSVGNVKAKSAGWQIACLTDVVGIVHRKTGSTKGYWNHCKYAAESAYYLHYHPLLVLLKMFLFMFQRPHYGFLPFSITYFSQWLQGAVRCQDEFVKQYYSKERPKEYYRYLKQLVKGRPSALSISWRDKPIDD
jgi:glycosyltransferase involved in cell wall biosynthesis